MILHIKRLGPIKQKSKINLNKNLLVFVGENNAGKSYVSQLIYALNNDKLDGYMYSGAQFLDSKNPQAPNLKNAIEKNLKKLSRQLSLHVMNKTTKTKLKGLA